MCITFWQNRIVGQPINTKIDHHILHFSQLNPSFQVINNTLQCGRLLRQKWRWEKTCPIRLGCLECLPLQECSLHSPYLSDYWEQFTAVLKRGQYSFQYAKRPFSLIGASYSDCQLGIAWGITRSFVTMTLICQCILNLSHYVFMLIYRARRRPQVQKTTRPLPALPTLAGAQLNMSGKWNLNCLSWSYFLRNQGVGYFQRVSFAENRLSRGILH